MSPLTIFISHSSELFTDHTPHGDGFVAYSVVTRLAERGHRVHVAAQEVDLARPTHPNVIVHHIDTKTKNVPVHRVRFALGARRLLKRLMKTEKIDIIHQLNPVYVGLSLGLVGIPIPIVLGSYAARWPNDPGSLEGGSRVSKAVFGFLRETLAHEAQKRAAALLVSTPAAVNQIPYADKLADRIHTVAYGIDTDLFVPAEGARPELKRDPQIILYLATLNRRKGIYDLLKAFETVAAAVPNCILKITGDGPEREKLERIAAGMEAGSRIEFLSFQARAVTADLHRECTVFCTASLGEPFGMAVVESMACGAPVVATAAGGHVHTVPSEGGILVPMHDPEALAEALIFILQNDADRARMSAYAQRWAKEQFGWDKVTSDLERVYAHVLGIEEAA